MSTVYVSEPIHPRVLDEMSARVDVLVGFGPQAVWYESVADRVEAVMLRGEPFPAARIEASPRLRIIARHGAGFDTVDVAAAQARGIAVTYCPGGNANAVAEQVFALLLSLARKVVECHDELTSGPWPKTKQHLVGQELSGRTLGIVGFGEIGKLVSRIAQGFGMGVLVFDPFLSPEVARDHGATRVEMEELLARSGVVSLHAPLTPATRHLMNADSLSRMRPEALLVNTARSGLVDEVALVDALMAGTIAGAGLDVADAERMASAEVRLGGRLLAEVPNLLLTPHVAGQTEQSLLRVGTTAWNDIQAVLSGQAPRYPVWSRERSC